MSKQTLLVSIALVAMLAVLGCNSDKVAAPAEDSVPPAAVLELDGAVADIRTLPTVKLTWKSGPELDLAGYRVYRSIDGGSNQLAASPTSTHWTDASVQKNRTYTYQISAIDLSGNESARSTKVIEVAEPGIAHPLEID